MVLGRAPALVWGCPFQTIQQLEIFNLSAGLCLVQSLGLCGCACGNTLPVEGTKVQGGICLRQRSEMRCLSSNRWYTLGYISSSRCPAQLEAQVSASNTWPHDGLIRSYKTKLVPYGSSAGQCGRDDGQPDLGSGSSHGWCRAVGLPLHGIFVIWETEY